MGIFNHNLEINKDNPFEMDKLKREEEAKILTNLFDIVGRQMVLAVNSPWGTGKTTFFNMWRTYLENEGYSTVYFNCWKNDFVEDPFIAFIEEFRQQLDSSIVSSDFKQKANEVGKCLIKNIPGAIMKGIKEKTGVDIGEVFSEDDLESLVASKLDNYSKTKDSVEKFKEELIKLEIKNIEKTEKPLIVFVDELDRCRPDFAISLLERVKHFFNVENIIFILGVDKESLSNSIKVIYGNGTDINGYLTRFIDMEYTLRQEYSKDYISFLIDKYDFKSIFEGRKNTQGHRSERSIDEFINITLEVLSVFEFSLRDIEKIISNLYLIVSMNKVDYLFPHPLIFLLALKKYDKLLYDSFNNHSITTGELINNLNSKIKFIDWLSDYNSRGYIIEAYLIHMIDDKSRIDEKKHNYIDIDKYCINCYEELPNIYLMSGINMHGRTIQKIDMYENYSF